MHRKKAEKQIFSLGYKCVAGIDEVGRGPLAGPVVSACVALDPEHVFKVKELKKIRDSKLLAEKTRERLYDLLMNEEIDIGIGFCPEKMIDKVNIFQASFLSMRAALENMLVKPDYVFIDGKFRLPDCPIRQEAVIGGDNKIFVIAAAGIVAKVTRDRLMRKWHEHFPQYGFDRHKGYGTRLHEEMIKLHGPSPIHRKSFSPVSNWSRL